MLRIPFTNFALLIGLGSTKYKNCQLPKEILSIIHYSIIFMIFSYLFKFLYYAFLLMNSEMLHPYFIRVCSKCALRHVLVKISSLMSSDHFSFPVVWNLQSLFVCKYLANSRPLQRYRRSDIDAPHCNRHYRDARCRLVTQMPKHQ